MTPPKAAATTAAGDAMTPAKTASLEWCTPGELARRWGVSANTVRNLLHERQSPDEVVPRGKLPAVRIGEQWRVHIRDVEAHERRPSVERPTPADVGKISRVARKRARLLAEPVTNHLGEL